jgi:hypothetical protein
MKRSKVGKKTAQNHSNVEKAKKDSGDEEISCVEIDWLFVDLVMRLFESQLFSIKVY